MIGQTPGEDPNVLSWRLALAPRPRHTTHGRHWWREYVTEMYRAARDARDAMRESGVQAPTSVAGAAGSQVAYFQIEREEFDRLFPAPTFRSFLEDLGGQEPPW